MGDWNFDDLLLPSNDSRYTNLDTNSSYSFNITPNNNQYATAQSSFTLYKDFDLGSGMLGSFDVRTPVAALSPGLWQVLVWLSAIRGINFRKSRQFRFVDCQFANVTFEDSKQFAATTQTEHFARFVDAQGQIVARRIIVG